MLKILPQRFFSFYIFLSQLAFLKTMHQTSYFFLLLLLLCFDFLLYMLNILLCFDFQVPPPTSEMKSQSHQDDWWNIILQLLSLYAAKLDSGEAEGTYQTQDLPTWGSESNLKVYNGGWSPVYVVRALLVIALQSALIEQEYIRS